MNSIVVPLQRAGTEGRNRPWFIQHLVRNLQSVLRDLDVVAVRTLMGRIDIEIGAASNLDSADARLARMRCASGSGGYSASPTSRMRDARPRFRRAGIGDSGRSRRHDRPKSFRVSARRADKRIPFTSPAIEREVGGRIKEAKGWRVDLDDPALTIHLEMLPDHAVLFLRQGGRRWRTADRDRRPRRLSALCGIDSPVAAYRMMRRGCSSC
jgi:thiamine biosynthesis protein ThiI